MKNAVFDGNVGYTKIDTLRFNHNIFFSYNIWNEEKKTLIRTKKSCLKTTFIIMHKEGKRQQYSLSFISDWQLKN